MNSAASLIGPHALDALKAAVLQRGRLHALKAAVLQWGREPDLAIAPRSARRKAPTQRRSDGYGLHNTRRSFDNDHERDLALTAAGFIVMRFTRDQIVKQPELVLVRLTRRLAELEARDPRRRPWPL